MQDMMKHKRQVSHYKKAISDITQKPTSGVIVYMLEDEVKLVYL
jgi:hypothetical protein